MINYSKVIGDFSTEIGNLVDQDYDLLVATPLIWLREPSYYVAKGAPVSSYFQTVLSLEQKILRGGIIFGATVSDPLYWYDLALPKVKASSNIFISCLDIPEADITTKLTAAGFSNIKFITITKTGHGFSVADPKKSYFDTEGKCVWATKGTPTQRSTNFLNNCNSLNLTYALPANSAAKPRLEYFDELMTVTSGLSVVDGKLDASGLSEENKATLKESRYVRTTPRAFFSDLINTFCPTDGKVLDLFGSKLIQADGEPAPGVTNIPTESDFDCDVFALDAEPMVAFE